jgi:tetratricopeptide (TPR) repeat protein
VADAKADGPLDRIFDVQDMLVRELLSGLGVTRPSGASSSHGARDTGSLAAYKAFVEGWLHVESLDIRELPTAIVAFERAIEADPRYAPAFAGLASAEFALYESTRTNLLPDKPRLDRAVAHARHAVDLDDRLAEAHATLALILVSTPHSEEAARAARRAVELEPGNWRHLFRLGHATWGDERLRAASSTLALYPDFAYSHFQMAMVHVARGHLAQAEAILRQGAAVQDQQISGGGRYPALGLHWLLGLVRLAQDDPSDAVREFDREIAVADPNRLYGREYAVEAYCARGFAFRDMQRTEQAAASFHEALTRDPDHVPARLAQRWITAQGGRDTSARGESDDLLRLMEQSRPADAAAMRAVQLAGERESEEALIVLARCIRDAPPGFTGWLLPIYPALRPLHAHPTFEQC